MNGLEEIYREIVGDISIIFEQFDYGDGDIAYFYHICIENETSYYETDREFTLSLSQTVYDAKFWLYYVHFPARSFDDFLSYLRSSITIWKDQLSYLSLPRGVIYQGNEGFIADVLYFPNSISLILCVNNQFVIAPLADVTFSSNSSLPLPTADDYNRYVSALMHVYKQYDVK